MKINFNSQKIVFTFFIILFLFQFIYAQTPTPAESDILRIDTKLIQIGASVKNKKGEFVDDLSHDDFEIKVDGKPINFEKFDKFLLGAASTTFESKDSKSDFYNIQQRTLIFFVDDEHLSFSSQKRTQQSILNFINNEMLENDLVLMVSSSGNIGFLQQFTNNKTVLRAAIERIINISNNTTPFNENPPMSEYEANAILYRDKDVIDRFVRLYVSRSNLDPRTAYQMTLARADTITEFSKRITRNTLFTLEQAITKSGRFPGRKAIYFFSDGFLTSYSNAEFSDQLNRLTSAATRTNSVIYSFDAKGLDASMPQGFEFDPTDASARLYNEKAASDFQMQDSLAYFANQTGGRFIHNTNDFQSKLINLVNEAFTFYQFSWAIDDEIKETEKLKRISVSVKGRPDLTINVQKGYLAQKTVNKKSQPDKKKIVLTEEQKLIAVTDSLNPNIEISTALQLNFLNSPNTPDNLFVTLQIDTTKLNFQTNGDQAEADLNVVGLIYNSSGNLKKTFKHPLKIQMNSANLKNPVRPPFLYDYQTEIEPGIYQLRVAIQDTKNKLIGSSSDWVEIPKKSPKDFGLSDLFFGEIKTAQIPVKSSPNDLPKFEKSIGKKFELDSILRFLGNIYELPNSNSNFSITARVMRQRKDIVSVNGRLLKIDNQSESIKSYMGEIDLKGLPRGFYELQVTIKDEKNKESLIKAVIFQII